MCDILGAQILFVQLHVFNHIYNILINNTSTVKIIIYITQDMIAHYQKDADGLIQRLLYPCPRRALTTAGLSYG